LKTILWKRQLTVYCRVLATLHQEADTCVLISIEDEQDQQQEPDSRKNGHVVSVIPKDEILRKTAQFDHFNNCPDVGTEKRLVQNLVKR
jgi:hypothetical protein